MITRRRTMYHASIPGHGRCIALAATYLALASALAGAAPPQKDVEATAPGSQVAGQDASPHPSLTQQQPPANPPEKQPAETPSRQANLIRLLIVVGPLEAGAPSWGS